MPLYAQFDANTYFGVYVENVTFLPQGAWKPCEGQVRPNMSHWQKSGI